MEDQNKDPRTDKMPEDLKEAARKVWLAGLGALSVAEREGSKLFRRLVDAGKEVRQEVKEDADKVRDDGRMLFDRLMKESAKIEDRVKDDLGEVMEDARERFDDLETRFKTVVDKAMKRAGVSQWEDEEQEEEEPAATEAPEEAAEEPTPTPEPEAEDVTVVVEQEKTIGNPDRLIATMEHVGGGWYEIEVNGQIVEKVQGKEEALAALQKYL